MKPKSVWWLVGGLLSVSAALYAGLYAAFADRGADIVFYTLLDIAFIPISALILTLVIGRLLEQRERDALLDKLNMVVGAFFSEVGTDLIDRLVAFDTATEAVGVQLRFSGKWSARDFAEARRCLVGHEHAITVDDRDLVPLRDFLVEHRPFLLRLLENQNLLEHAAFTDMLWAVFHLSDELASRPDLSVLTAPDARHIEGDMARAYGRALAEWLRYVEHLKESYPYLFSFAVRTNPFDPEAEIQVKA